MIDIGLLSRALLANVFLSLIVSCTDASNCATCASGTMATQDANAVAITGGSISGVSLGANSVAITGGSISGVSLGANSVAITGGSISGVSLGWNGTATGSIDGTARGFTGSLSGDASGPQAATLVTATHLASPLPVAQGGTGGTAAPTAGAVAYGTGSAYAFTSAGTEGQKLQSNGTGAPTWVHVPTAYFTEQPIRNSSTSFVDVITLPVPSRAASTQSYVYYTCTVGARGTTTSQPKFRFTYPGTAEIHDVWMKFMTSLTAPTWEVRIYNGGTTGCTSGCLDSGSGTVWHVEGFGYAITNRTLTLQVASSTAGQEVMAESVMCLVY